jgi:hypothetical protein
MHPFLKKKLLELKIHIICDFLNPKIDLKNLKAEKNLTLKN